jgi:hypothetical protein
MLFDHYSFTITCTCQALSHAEEEDEVMEMMEPDAADIMMGRFYKIDHSKLPLITRDARRKRFLERAQVFNIKKKKAKKWVHLKLKVNIKTKF